MKLRAPAVPLITVDPYFSVWSPADRLTDTATVHWTGKPNTLLGVAEIDGVPYRFLGAQESLPAMEQTALEITALSTTYRFAAAGVRLTAVFTSPLLPEDPGQISRPVSYLELSAEGMDGAEHTVRITLKASEELCLDHRGQDAVTTETVALGEGIAAIRMGSVSQPVLEKAGDDIRIDWGYLWLCLRSPQASAWSEQADGMTFVCVSAPLEGGSLLAAFAYDDIASGIYFGQTVKSWWNRAGKTIETAIREAFADYPALVCSCREFSDRLYAEAVELGGEQYAELLSLAYRQVIAAHKLWCGPDGELLFISKECFSNGCAATADVTYPSAPMFLLYAPALLKGTLHPIFRYAESDAWPYEYAPHDAGCYPHVNGQVYSNGTDPTWQMPVEECGNMLLLMTALALAEGDASFAGEHLPILTQWAEYLLAHGADPEHQLCTDDFAGHLSHNCNLSLKAILALAGFGILLEMLGDPERAAFYRAQAGEMADSWRERAANGDGSYRLAFDQPGSFSMKYNILWDKVFGTGLFPEELFRTEFQSYLPRINRYGMPLDNRADYTKSDWLLWCACLAESKEDFARFIAPMWEGYNASESRVPMTDWYDTLTAGKIAFQHRSVQGGLFLKLLLAKGICRRS